MGREIRKQTLHSMKRRSLAHEYNRCGYYHITISVAKGLRQPLGKVVGRLDKPDGDSEAPHVELSPIGQMVEEELRESISRVYPMLEVQDYVVMPEHLHFLLVAHHDVLSRSGKKTHLGHVIAGFKYGCNRRYWVMTGALTNTGSDLATESPGTVMPVNMGADTADKNEKNARNSVLGDSVAKKHYVATKELTPLFEAGYCDVMPVDTDQLATQRAYIHANPRSRLQRTLNRIWLQPQRLTINTAVSLRALYGYLKRECPQQFTEFVFSDIEKRLLKTNNLIMCDSYGNSQLLNRRLLPVVCHRKDAALLAQQKARCLAEAASGAVLVSARISRGEQEIIDNALLSGYPAIRIEDNGFADIFHPSANRIDDCASGNLLLITPWTYQYQSRDKSISVPFCKTMNCIAQAICKTKDNWWKEL
ncbi:MAG: hypothetical protein IJV13_06925 [Prevotella sp.]|nr:hypothetical protein [Prevotella sp.]